MGQRKARDSSGNLDGEILMHFQNHKIDRWLVLGLKKGLVDMESFCIDQVSQGGNPATRRVLICGLYDSGVALGANPYVLNRPNSGVEPETKPVRAQGLPSLLSDRRPFPPCEEDIRHLPFLKVTAAPEAGTIRFPDDGNVVVVIHVAIEKLAHMGVVDLPVREKIGAKGAAACRVFRNIMQKCVIVIRTIAQWAWRRIRVGRMRENLIMKGPVISPNDHGLQTAGTTRARAVSMAALGIQFWAKFRRVRLDGDLFFDAVRVKRCFHGSNSFFMYLDVEIQRYKRLESPSIIPPEGSCALA